jgi:hypothetical protein
MIPWPMSGTKLDRRTFLTGTGVSAAATLLGACRWASRGRSGRARRGRRSACDRGSCALEEAPRVLR